MRRYKTILNVILLSSAIFLIFLSGCGSSSRQPDAELQNAKQQQEEEKEPEKLKNIESKLETLIETLGGPSVKMDEKGGDSNSSETSQRQNTPEQSTQPSDAPQRSAQQQSAQRDTRQLGLPEECTKQHDTQQQSTQQQNTQQQGTEQQNTQQQGTQQQNTQQQSTQPQNTQQQSIHPQNARQQDTQQQNTQQQGTQQQGTQQQGTQQQGTQQQNACQLEAQKWDETNAIISELHYQWNDFMPEAAKKGADIKIIDSFDNALNTLTTTVEAKDQEKALTSANALYSCILDLYSIYKVKMSPEAKRIVYYARNIILESKKGGWEQAKKDGEAIEKSWSLFRNTLEKEQQKIGDKLDFSIYELNKVISENNKQLTDIKGRIVLSNIKELQKSFEEQ